MEEINGLMPEGNVEYTEDNIRHLDDMEHIRVRSGMYIGRLGDGTQNDDGIYVLLKEVMDNSIDEFKMGAGKRIEISIEENLRVSVRDYGRGIPQGKLIEAVSKLNTGGKYDSKAFKKSVGLNGVGIKAVNALSNRFEVRSYREGKVRIAIFEKGILQSDVTENSDEESGTYIFFVLGCSASITPLHLAGITNLDLLVLVGSSILLWFFGLFFAKRTITRIEGSILILCYIAYTVVLIYNV